MAYKNYDMLSLQQKVNEIDNKCEKDYVDEKVNDINSSLEDITNDLYVRNFTPKFDQSITVGHVNGITGQTSTRTEEQLLATLTSYKNLGIDGVYIILHVGINTSTNQLFVAGGDDYISKVNYIITKCGELGLDVRAIKIHQETISGQMKLSDITSSIGIDNFKTQYTTIIDSLTTTFADKTSNFIILNEFEELYTSTTYQDFCITLLTSVKNKGFDTSISCLSFGSFLKMTDTIKTNLDFISINFYPPIGFEGVNTPLDTATNIFLSSNVLEYIDLFVKKYNKPIHITETGCMDIAEAMVYGYKWVFDDMTTYNGEIQKIFLNCIFSTLNISNIKSIGYWWDLDASLSSYIKTYLGKEDR